MEYSVVVPAYNREASIVRAVESALAQTLPPTEVIVVDDRSTDATVKVVRKRFEGEARVVVVESELNAGACVARNVGIEKARSEWIAFLDSDDAWHREKMSRQARAIVRQPGAVASVTGMAVISEGRVTRNFVPSNVTGPTDLFRSNVLGSTSTFVARKAALVSAGGFDAGLQSCQDWDVYLRLFSYGTFAVVPDILVDYDDGMHDRISRSSPKVESGRQAVFSRIYAMAGKDAGRWRHEHAIWRAEMVAYQEGRLLKGLVRMFWLVAVSPTRERLIRSIGLARYVAWKWARQLHPKRIGSQVT